MSVRIILSFILLLIAAQLAFMGFSYFEYSIRSPGQFYGRLPNQKNKELTALNRPIVSNRALLSWATIAATASYSLDFVNYENDLKKIKQYFTEEGFQNFLLALEESGTTKTIVEKKLILSSVPIGPATIVGEDEIRGYHIWKVELPITVSYISASAEEKREKLISLTITQVPTYQAISGIGISQYISTDLSPDIMG